MRRRNPWNREMRGKVGTLLAGTGPSTTRGTKGHLSPKFNRLSKKFWTEIELTSEIGIESNPHLGDCLDR